MYMTGVINRKKIASVVMSELHDDVGLVLKILGLKKINQNWDCIIMYMFDNKIVQGRLFEISVIVEQVIPDFGLHM